MSNKNMSTSRPLSILLILGIFNKAITQQCSNGGSEESTFGWMLQGHIYKSMNANHGHQCVIVCRQDNRCQSFNWMISLNKCEFSDSTKKSRPVDFVPDPDRYYFRRDMNREHASCEAIKRSNSSASEGSYTILSKSFVIPVYCDMTSEDGWTLIARFSNNDDKHWMNDSGLWWYDKNVAYGRTTDTSRNGDMISSAFWLVSGTEFKITRSDDPQHTALLKTTSLCLGGKTFRSKITNYGDFRNGKTWSKNQCLGTCSVQYGGQFQTTTGFKEATCNGNIQGANSIGFWCHWSSGDASVMMIGGGGTSCSRADHGIGVTEANTPSFVYSSERDFGNDASNNPVETYSLNLWVK